MQTFDATELVKVFDGLFSAAENTVLRGGADEPLYLPAHAGEPAQVIFTRDYFASALHEIAHWCLAGAQRRLQRDYGYWYISNRSPEQQRQFEQVEVKPQALEWIFAEQLSYPFQPSLDYLQDAEYRAEEFRSALSQQRAQFLRQGLPARAERFRAALQAYAAQPEAV